MNELFDLLINDAIVLSYDPNVKLYAAVCAVISMVLFAIGLAMYLRDRKIETAQVFDDSTSETVAEYPYCNIEIELVNHEKQVAISQS